MVQGLEGQTVPGDDQLGFVLLVIEIGRMVLVVSRDTDGFRGRFHDRCFLLPLLGFRMNGAGSVT